MIRIKISLTLMALILLASCTQSIYQPIDMNAAIQNAKTKADHEALATRYEQIAHEMHLKVEEHKKRLIEYQALFPPYSVDYVQFKDHCLQLIKIYSQAEEENLALARLHRQIASALSD